MRFSLVVIFVTLFLRQSVRRNSNVCSDCASVYFERLSLYFYVCVTVDSRRFDETFQRARVRRSHTWPVLRRRHTYDTVAARHELVRVGE